MNSNTLHDINANDRLKELSRRLSMPLVKLATTLSSICRAFNLSQCVEELAVKLDLMNPALDMSLDEAERFYEACCEDIIEQMKMFWCIDGKFTFSKAFEDAPNYFGLKHKKMRFVLPSLFFRDKGEHDHYVLATSCTDSMIIAEPVPVHYFYRSEEAFHEAFRMQLQQLTYKFMQWRAS